MKIAILTQPLHNNYGGLLQAFALQKVLRGMGHDVWTVDRFRKTLPFYRKVLSIIKRAVLRYVLGRKILVRAWMSKRELAIISKDNIKFIRNNITTTVPIDTTEKLKLLERYKFDAYVVGSDQVWRPKYSPCLSNFFLDFVVDNSSAIKKIAYAASFGTDQWEFTPEQLETCKPLAQKFNAISVREKSGMELCQKYLEVEAKYVLDPTLLLDKNEYIDIVAKDNTAKSTGNLMVYILDNSSIKENIVVQISRKLKLTPFQVLPLKKFDDLDRNSIDECVYPSVVNWIRGFMDAEFVVTDSFHGTVFSILFNKPFVVIRNAERGSARFESLLSMFKLEDRLIESNDDIDECWFEEIDYVKVNSVLNKERERSITFLNQSLQ